MVIYLDLVMGLNFLVDLLLILGTNRLCGFPSGLLRVTTAAALGGVYAAWAFVSGFTFLGSTFWRMVFLVLMGIIAFGLNRSAWRRTGIFLLLSMAMGGVALGISREGIPALLLSAAIWQPLPSPSPVPVWIFTAAPICRPVSSWPASMPAKRLPAWH